MRTRTKPRKAKAEKTELLGGEEDIDGEGKRTRVGSRLEGDTKVRFSKASGATIAEKKK